MELFELYSGFLWCRIISFIHCWSLWYQVIIIYAFMLPVTSPKSIWAYYQFKVTQKS